MATDADWKPYSDVSPSPRRLFMPRYNDRLGPSLEAKPPFTFQGVTQRVLPLRADIDRLQAFCDDYLNIVDPEIAHFQASAPYVFVMVVHYGKMEMENVGWVSQNEVVFSVWVDWYKKIDGKMVFQTMASVCPYIFVDNVMSQATGREVYGWNKVQYSVGQTLPWTSGPETPTTMLDLRATLMPEVFSDATPEPRTLLEIEHRESSWSETPPNRSVGRSPFLAMPRAWLNYSSMWADMADQWLGLPARGYQSGRLLGRKMPPQLLDMVKNMNGIASSPFYNTLTLKQFRDASHGQDACYQALVNSRLTIARFARGGLMNDSAQFAGDTSGGYRVILHHHPSLPVLSRLGLEPESVTSGDTVRLKPAFPFWYEADIGYGCGDVIGWRTRHGVWQPGRESSPPRPKETRSETTTLISPELPSMPTPVDPDESPPQHTAPPYNTATGPSMCITGPFEIKDTLVRVLPLLADPEKLEEFCSAFMNQALKDDSPESAIVEFHPYGNYVYVVSQAGGNVFSPTNNIGDWLGKALRFVVPVYCWQASADFKQLRASSGVISAYVFSDNQLAVTTSREIYGWPAQLADLVPPPTTWLDGSTTQVADRLLQVRAEVLASIGQGQPARKETLLEVVRAVSDPLPEPAQWRRIADDWGQDIKAECQRKFDEADENAEELRSARARALHSLMGGGGIDEFAFKQFRDANQPELACYQALIRFRFGLDQLRDLRESEDQLHVRILECANLPIVSTLGLKVKRTEFTDRGTVRVLEPVRPFSFRADVSWSPGDKLFVREPVEHDADWSGPIPWTEEFAEERLGSIRAGWEEQDGMPVLTDNATWRPKGVPNPRVVDWLEGRLESGLMDELWNSAYAVALQSDQIDKRRHATAVAKAWLRGRARLPTNLRADLTPAQWAHATIVTPQSLIESILSARWCDQSAGTSNKPLPSRPTFLVRRDTVGPLADELFPKGTGNENFVDGITEGWWTPSKKPPTAKKALKKPPAATEKPAATQKAASAEAAAKKKAAAEKAAAAEKEAAERKAAAEIAADAANKAGAVKATAERAAAAAEKVATAATAAAAVAEKAADAKNVAYKKKRAAAEIAAAEEKATAERAAAAKEAAKDARGAPINEAAPKKRAANKTAKAAAAASVRKEAAATAAAIAKSAAVLASKKKLAAWKKKAAANRAAEAANKAAEAAKNAAEAANKAAEAANTAMKKKTGASTR